MKILGLGHVPRGRFLWIFLPLLMVTALLLVDCGGTTTTATSPAAATQLNPITQIRPTPTSSTTTVNVQIDEEIVNGKPTGKYFFQRPAVTINKGTQVIWTNKTGVLHTVTSDDGRFPSSRFLKKDETFSSTFTTAGVYKYHCSIHLYMKGVIVVR